MMMKKPISTACYVTLLLLSHTGVCATNESETATATSQKVTQEVATPVQTITDAAPAAPAKPAPLTAPQEKPVTAPANSAVLSKPVPTQNIPLKPATTLPLPSKPDTPPATLTNPASASAQQKPAPASTPVKNPIQVPPVKTSPAGSAVTPAKPLVPPAPKPTMAPVKKPEAKPAPIQQIPAPAQTKIKQAAPSVQAVETNSNPLTHTVDIEVFMREGCLNCIKATEFLDKLKAIQPQLRINIRDVRKEPAALELLKRVAQNQGNPNLEYPAFVVGGQLIIGFSEEANTAQQVLDNLPLSHSSSEQSGDGDGKCESGREPSCGLIPVPPPAKAERIVINILGYNIPLGQIGMPLFTLAMGMLDGLNHGSTWVLVLMISLLAPLKDRSRTFTIAGTFIAVKTLSYYILIVIWFNIFALVNFTRIAQVVVAAVALLAGMIYFKNYLFFGKTLSLSSQEITKPGIYTHIRKIVQAQTLVTSILGTIALAIFVLISEFSYTSIFPSLYAAVLNMQKLGTLHNYSYLMLYDFAYMLDDFIILAIAVFTLNPIQTQQRKGPNLLLASSLILAALGVYLLINLH